MQSKLHKELAFYKEKQNELVEQYQGKFVVIKDQEITGEAQKKFELGTFLIQQVEAGEDSYSQTFYSRVHI